MSKILLQSNDNEICEVDRDVVRLITMFQGSFAKVNYRKGLNKSATE